MQKSVYRIRAGPVGRVGAILLFTNLISWAEVYDRVAVAVGNHAIKASDIDRDIRLTAFLNGGKLDFSLPEQRKAADRLIDQWMIREEMAKRNYAAVSAANADEVFNKIKAARFPNTGEYQQALNRYGISESELKAHVAWQATVVRFIADRFQSQAFFNWLNDSRKRASIQFRGELSQ